MFSIKLIYLPSFFVVVVVVVVVFVVVFVCLFSFLFFYIVFSDPPTAPTPPDGNIGTTEVSVPFKTKKKLSNDKPVRSVF